MNKWRWWMLIPLIPALLLIEVLCYFGVMFIWFLLNFRIG